MKFLLFEQWFYSTLGYYTQMLNIELKLTCKYCDKEIEAHNIINHIKWHEERKDIKIG